MGFARPGWNEYFLFFLASRLEAIATTVDGPNIQTPESITIINRPPKVNVEQELIEFLFPGFDLFRPFAKTLLQDLKH